jgi:hypothetical protein
MDIIAVELDFHPLQFRDIEIILRREPSDRDAVCGYGSWILFPRKDILVPSESDEPLFSAFQQGNRFWVILQPFSYSVIYIYY